MHTTPILNKKLQSTLALQTSWMPIIKHFTLYFQQNLEGLQNLWRHFNKKKHSWAKKSVVVNKS